MAEITREQLAAIRQEYIDEIDRLDGAIAAINDLEKKLFPPDALTLDELAHGLGAEKAEVVKNAD